eukprot:3663571-Pyramimonas_sp.AAC.1
MQSRACSSMPALANMHGNAARAPTRASAPSCCGTGSCASRATSAICRAAAGAGRAVPWHPQRQMAAAAS